MLRSLIALILLLQIPPVRTIAPSAGGSTVTSSSISSLNEALVAYFSMNEASGTRTDSISQVNLADVNTVPSTAGKQGNAARFTAASSQYLQRDLPNGQINIDGSKGITIATWLKIRTGAPTNAAFFFTGARDGGAPRMGLETSNIGQLVVVCYFTSYAGGLAQTSLTLPALDTWYYMVCTYDPQTHKATLTRDVSADTNTGTAMVGHPVINYALGTGVIQVGAWTFPSSYSTSDIDELGVWNKVWTNTELIYIYNGGTGRTWPF
jgi:hypothetical protein